MVHTYHKGKYFGKFYFPKYKLFLSFSNLFLLLEVRVPIFQNSSFLCNSYSVDALDQNSDFIEEAFIVNKLDTLNWW